MATKKRAKKKPARKTTARKRAAPARAKRAKSVFVRNFTGRISQNPDKTISVVGRGRRGSGK
jgi:hypothetical protein